MIESATLDVASETLLRIWGGIPLLMEPNTSIFLSLTLMADGTWSCPHPGEVTSSGWRWKHAWWRADVEKIKGVSSIQTSQEASKCWMETDPTRISLILSSVKGGNQWKSGEVGCYKNITNFLAKRENEPIYLERCVCVCFFFWKGKIFIDTLVDPVVLNLPRL